MTRALERVRRLANQFPLLLPEACEGPVANPNNAGGPLKGIKVLDLTAFQNGPSATVQLAEQGAIVIKIEPPEGEGLRFTDKPGRYHAHFQTLNRGKKSVTMDLKHPDSKKIMERLVKWADVVCENFRPYVMDNFGLGYEQLKAWNPAIILASNSGFGDRGEWANRPSYDAIAQAFTGVGAMQGGGPSHKPSLVEWAFSDEVGAMNFHASILTAIIARLQTGKGQHIVTSQSAATLYFQRFTINGALKSGKQRDDGEPAGFPARAVQQMYKCGDGKWMMVSTAQKAQFVRFCVDVLNRPDIPADEKLAQYPVVIPPNRDFVLEECGKTMATNTRDHWLELCAKHSVPAGPCSSYADLGDEQGTVGKHLFANDYLMKVTDRDYGEMTNVGVPTRYEGTPNQHDVANWHSPDLGEHTTQTLQDMGFSAAEIADLNKPGGAAPPAIGAYAPSKKR